MECHGNFPSLRSAELRVKESPVNAKAAWNANSTASLSSRYGIVGSDRSEVGHIDSMSSRVHDERVTTKMRRGVLENTILIGGLLMNDGNRADAICGVDVAQGWIVSRAIDSRTDGENCDNCACFRIHHD